MKPAENKNLRKFIKIIFKYKSNNFIALVLISISTILDLFVPQVIRGIVDNGILSKNTTLLCELAVFYLCISLISSACKTALDFIYSKINKRIVSKLRIDVMNHLSKLSGRYFTDMKTGELMNIIDTDIYIIESSGIQLFFSILVNVVTAIIAFIYLVVMQKQLLIIVIIIEVIMIFCQRYFTRSISKQTRYVREKAGKLSGLSQEYLSDMIYVIMLRAKSFFIRNYTHGVREYAQKAIRLDISFSLNQAVANSLNSLVIASIYGYGGYMVVMNKMTFGELIAFQQYTGMFLGPLLSLIKSYGRIQQVLVSITRVFNILDEPVEIKQVNNGFKPNSVFEGSIMLKDVYFSYGEQQILKSVNMTFDPGTVTGIAGNSGSGKSTITKLIFRLWDIDSGKIMIDGIDIREYNLKALRKKISIISQDVLLFDDTILNNLTLGDQKIIMEQIKYICKKIGIYD